MSATEIGAKLEDYDNEHVPDAYETDERPPAELVSPQDEDREDEDRSQEDEDIGDLFGDDKDVEEVKAERCVNHARLETHTR